MPLELHLYQLFAEGGGLGALGTFFPFIVIGVLFYFMLIKPERRKQQSHRDMLANVKKSDRIVTVGGIKGVVSNVNKDADEVTLVVDESSGAKIRVTLASIARLENSESKKNSSS